MDINLLVCDSVFDGQERYDSAFFDFDKNLSNGFVARMRQGDWTPFALPLAAPADPQFPDFASGVVGSWVKLLAFETDLSAFTIYLGDVTHNVGYPKSFVDQIDESVGFWPAEPKFFNLEGDRIDEATYMEQLERLASYLKDTILLAMKTYDFDLLMGYQVQTDEAGHQFLLIDSRQQSFQDSDKRNRYAGYIEEAYRIADSNLKEIIDAAELGKSNIIAVSRPWDVAVRHARFSKPNPPRRRTAHCYEYGHGRSSDEPNQCRDRRWRRQHLHQSSRARTHRHRTVRAVRTVTKRR